MRIHIVTKEKLLSVIVPVYKVEPYLRVVSILSDVKPIEIYKSFLLMMDLLTIAEPFVMNTRRLTLALSPYIRRMKA